MRMLMQVDFPHAPFNAAIRDGTVGAKLQKILADLKPEAVYFTEFSGLRNAVLIVNIDDAAKIPALAEPWFLLFQANVHLHPTMTAEDLARAGLESLAKKWS